MMTLRARYTRATVLTTDGQTVIGAGGVLLFTDPLGGWHFLIHKGGDQQPITHDGPAIVLVGETFNPAN